MVKAKEIQQYIVQSIAECFATCVLILIGEAGIANYKFAGQTTHSTLPISLSFGVGVYSALMIAGSVSDAHVNPAVTIALMTIRKVKPLQCVFYIIGQILGAFLGAALIYLIYYNQFNEFDGGIRQMTGANGTADIFFTNPSKEITGWNIFIAQVISTGLLMIYIMALTNKMNRMISEVAKPFAFLLIIMAIMSAFSVNVGAAINPARELGPRLFGTFIYGWKNVIYIQNYFFYILIIGPIVGAILGVWIYVAYYWIVRKYGHSLNREHTDLVKLDRRTKQTKDDSLSEN